MLISAKTINNRRSLAAQRPSESIGCEPMETITIFALFCLTAIALVAMAGNHTKVAEKAVGAVEKTIEAIKDWLHRP